MLKKVSLAVAIFTGSLNAQQWFVGVEYPMMSNMSTKWDVSGAVSYSGNADFSYQPLKLKVGVGTPGDWNMNIYYQTAKRKYDRGFEDDEAINELGYDIRKEFGLEGVQGLAPYVQGGIGYGWQKLPKISNYYTTYSDMSLFSVKAGIGIAYLFTNHFQGVLGIDYKYRASDEVEFMSITEPSYTVKQTDTGTQLYIGLNFWFGEDTQVKQDKNNSEHVPITGSESELSPSINVE